MILVPLIDPLHFCRYAPGVGGLSGALGLLVGLLECFAYGVWSVGRLQSAILQLFGFGFWVGWLGWGGDDGCGWGRSMSPFGEALPCGIDCGWYRWWGDRRSQHWCFYGVDFWQGHSASSNLAGNPLIPSLRLSRHDGFEVIDGRFGHGPHSEYRLSPVFTSESRLS
jgi:hypothetical protein